MATERQNTAHLGSRGWRLFRLLEILLPLATAGCAGQGLLYTRVVSPYSNDFHATPTGSKTCRVNEQAAYAAGMTNLYYADMETVSILKGIYERKTLILCGD